MAEAIDKLKLLPFSERWQQTTFLRGMADHLETTLLLSGAQKRRVLDNPPRNHTFAIDFGCFFLAAHKLEKTNISFVAV